MNRRVEANVRNFVVLLLLSLSSGMRLAMVTVVFSSFFISSPYFSLTTFSISSLQIVLPVSVGLHLNVIYIYIYIYITFKWRLYKWRLYIYI